LVGSGGFSIGMEADDLRMGGVGRYLMMAG
jgi:hypothetical protein